mmetsp:Transcript_15322/g.36541  ORF Transcript_15322/g.36541 Transcript_15322/m.36541 type:complete len:205 (+) Transcript_15322:415-1029(+)
MVSESKYEPKMGGASSGMYTTASVVIKVFVGRCKKAASETGPAFSGNETYSVRKSNSLAHGGNASELFGVPTGSTPSTRYPILQLLRSRPQLPKGPYCPGVSQTLLALGYFLTNADVGILCSNALQGMTTCFTSPSSSNREQYSPVGHCGPNTINPPSCILTTTVRTVAVTLAKTSSCSSAHALRPSSYRYVARLRKGGVNVGK